MDVTTTDSALAAAAAAAEAWRLLNAQPNPQEAVCIAQCVDFLRETSGVDDVEALKAALYAVAAAKIEETVADKRHKRRVRALGSAVRAGNFPAALDVLGDIDRSYRDRHGRGKAKHVLWCHLTTRTLNICRFIQAA